MPTPLVIKIGDLELKGEFNDTPTGQAAVQAKFQRQPPSLH